MRLPHHFWRLEGHEGDAGLEALFVHDIIVNRLHFGPKGPFERFDI